MTHVTEVCKMGQGKECCRYLMMGTGGFECAKLSGDNSVRTMASDKKFESAKELLDARVENNEMNAQGDNCEGVKNDES